MGLENAQPPPSPLRSVDGRIVNVRVLTLLCYGGMVCLACGMVHYPIILTEVAGDFSLTATQAGSIGSIAFLGFIVSVLVMTPLAQWRGEKTAVLLSLMCCVVACIAETMSTNYTTISAAVFLQGFGCSGMDLLLSPIVAAMHADTVTASLSFLHSFFSTGAVVCTIGSTALLSATGNWRVVPRCMMPLPCVILFLMSRQPFPLVVPDTMEAANDDGVSPNVTCTADPSQIGEPSVQKPPAAAKAQSRETPLAVLLADASFWICVAMIVLGAAAEVGPETWLPAYIQTGLGFSPSPSGFCLTLFMVWMALGRILGGVFGDRLNPFAVIACGGSLQALLVTVAANAQNSPLIGYAAAAGIGFSIAMLWPTALSIGALMYPRGGTKLFAILTVTGGAGASGAAWLVGFVKDSTSSIPTAFWSSATTGFVLCPIAVVAWRLHESKRRAVAKTSPLTEEGVPPPSPPALVVRGAPCCVMSEESPRSFLDSEDLLPVG